MKLYQLRKAVGKHTLIEEHRAVIEQLLSGDYISKDLEKLRGHNIYSFRVSGAARLLFAIDAVNGARSLIVLEYLPTHDYQTSWALRKGVVSRFKERNSDALNTAVSTNATDDEPQSFQFITVEEKPESLFRDKVNGLENEGYLEYYKNNLVELSDSQNEALYVKLPAILSGVAGGGKSCVCMSMMNLLLQPDSGQILYCAKSSLLVREMRKDFAELPLSNEEKTRVHFKTYEELALENDVVKEQLVEFSYFEIWYKEIIKNLKAQCKAKRHTADNDDEPVEKEFDARQVYDEFLVTCGYDQTEYNTLSDIDSSIDKAYRNKIYSWFEQYRKHLINVQKVDLNFQTLPESLYGSYQTVFSDESQDSSCLQLQEIGKLAPNKSVLFCVDSHQNLIGTRSTKQYLSQKVIPKAPRVFLNKSYRSELKIVAAMNALVEIKQRLTGGLAEKEETKKVHPSELNNQGMGHVRLMSYNELAANTWLQAHSDKSYFVVVTRFAQKEEVKKLFPNAKLVMTPEEIKGLEYPIVVSYGLGTETIYREMTRKWHYLGDSPQPQNMPGAGARDDRFTAMFNSKYVAWSRAQKVLVVCEPEANPTNPLLKSIQPLCDRTPLNDQCIDGICDDWKGQLALLILKGMDDLAKEIYVSKLKGSLENYETFAKELRIQEQGPLSSVTVKNLSESKNYRMPIDASSQTKAAKASPDKIQNVVQQNNEPSVSEATTAVTLSDDGLSLLNLIITNLKSDTLDQTKIKNCLTLLTTKCPEYEKSKPYKELLNYIATTPSLRNLLIAYYSNTLDCPHAKFWQHLKLHTQHLPFYQDISLLEKIKTELNRELNQYAKAKAYITAPIQVAAFLGKTIYIQDLTRLGCDVNKPDTNGATSVQIATIYSKINSLRVLHSVNADFNTPNNIVGNFTPVFTSVLHGNDEVLTVLHELGADIDKLNSRGDSLVIFAVKMGNIGILKTLHKLGANFDICDADGVNVACAAMINNQLNALRTLHQLGFNLYKPGENNLTPADIASKAGNVEGLRMLHELHIDLNKSSDRTDLTPLIIAIVANQLNSVKYLLDIGVSIDSRFIVRQSQLNSYEKALNREAQIHIQDYFSTHPKSGFMMIAPLDLAKMMGHKEIYNLLSTRATVHKNSIFSIQNRDEKKVNEPQAHNSGPTKTV